MSTAQIILLSGEGNISNIVADSLSEYFHVKQISFSIDTFCEIIKKEKTLLSKADITILNLSEINIKAEQALSSFIALYSELPIIVMHLYNQKVFAKAFLNMGAKAYLPVNFYTDDLLAAIDHVLSEKTYIGKNVY